MKSIIKTFYEEAIKKKEKHVCNEVLDMSVNRFMTEHDKILGVRFASASLEEKTEIINNFQRPDCKDFAETILLNNYSRQLSSKLKKELIEKEFHKNIESTSCCRPDFKEILSECEKLALEKPEAREKMENLKTWLLRLKSNPYKHFEDYHA